MSTCTLGMDNTFRDTFSVKMSLKNNVSIQYPNLVSYVRQSFFSIIYQAYQLNGNLE